MSQYSTLILIAFMVVAFYFLIMRPQRKRQQAVAKTLSELTPGTRVMLGSGLFGTVVRVGQKQVVLETSPGIELTVLKQAIARVVTEEDEDTAATDLADFEPDELAEPEEQIAAEPDAEPPGTGAGGAKPASAG